MNGASRNARQWLLDAQPQDTHQFSLKTWLLAYLDEGFIGPAEEAAWTACVLAFVSVCKNHYRIGALIVDDAFNIVSMTHTVKRATPYEFICKLWTKESERFTLDPLHQMPGLNNLAPIH